MLLVKDYRFLNEQAKYPAAFFEWQDVFVALQMKDS